MLNNIPTNISIVEGNKGFKLHFTCQDSTGAVIDLTGTTIAFNAQLESDTSVQSTGNMVIDNPTLGTCYYTVGANDFTIAGKYNAQIAVTYSTAELITFGGIIINVLEKLPI